MLKWAPLPRARRIVPDIWERSAQRLLTGGPRPCHPNGMALISPFCTQGQEDEARKASAGTHALQPLRAKQGELVHLVKHGDWGCNCQRSSGGLGNVPSQSRRGARPAGVYRGSALVLPASGFILMLDVFILH